MGDLPTGTVTFLFTDIEGSTRLWEERPDEMRAALAEHDTIVRTAIESHGGYVFATGGDGFASAFSRAADAVAAAEAAQAALASHPFLKVRMGAHTGEVQERAGDYFGPAVNRAARLMAAAHGGQTLVSAATVEIVGREGLTDLGEHRLRDLSTPIRVFQLGATSFPSIAAFDQSRTNLPVQLTEFIGRADDLDEIGRAIELHPLVTITGVGGVGKTRVAVQAAADRLPLHGDGVWFVDLTGVVDLPDVPQAFASSLLLSQRGGLSLTETVVEFLRHREAMLVIDNCEHVLDAVRTLTTALLGAVRNVKLLVTSREPLDIDGEQIIALGALRTPSAGMAAEEVAAIESVRLFSDRAVLSNAGFRLDGESIAVVGELCRRLEGIPLAIELAAARMRMMTPRDALERLDQRFRLLAAAARGTKGRHDTLRAAIDWSHALLSQPERQLLHRLSVFAGRFTLDDAEQVCGGDEVDRWDVIDLLGQLVDKSLVVADRSGPIACFRLLEMVREYAVEHLDFEALTSLRECHADWMIALAEQLDAGLKGADERAWLPRLDVESDNLRAAAAWLVSTGDVARMLRLGAAVKWAGHVVASSGFADVAAQAWVMSRSANGPIDPVAASLAASAEAARLNGEAIEAILGEIGDQADLTSWGWYAHAMLSLMRGDWGAANESFVHAAEREAHTQDASLVYWLGCVVAVQAAFGDAGVAERTSERALRISQQVGSPTGRAYALWAQSSLVALGLGDLEGGVRIAEESERVATTKHVSALASFNQAQFLMLLRRDREAISPLMRAVELADRSAELQNVLWLLEIAVVIFGRLGFTATAARLFGRLEASNHHANETDRSSFDETIAQARHQLGPAGFDEQARLGAGMTPSELVSYLREVASEIVP